MSMKGPEKNYPLITLHTQSSGGGYIFSYVKMKKLCTLVFICCTWDRRIIMLLNNINCRGVPHGAVVKNPPASAGVTGSSPGPGRSHMPRSN